MTAPVPAAGKTAAGTSRTSRLAAGGCARLWTMPVATAASAARFFGSGLAVHGDRFARRRLARSRFRTPPRPAVHLDAHRGPRRRPVHCAAGRRRDAARPRLARLGQRVRVWGAGGPQGHAAGGWPVGAAPDVLRAAVQPRRLRLYRAGPPDGGGLQPLRKRHLRAVELLPARRRQDVDRGARAVRPAVPLDRTVRGLVHQRAPGSQHHAVPPRRAGGRSSSASSTCRSWPNCTASTRTAPCG